MSLESAPKIKLNKNTHSVRASQAVLQYGVGAMVDFPDQTLMTAAPEYWQERVQIIHDERFEKKWHVSHFGMPGSMDIPQYSEGISYARFPEWYFCPKCRKFQPLKKWIDDYRHKMKQSTLDEDPYMARHMKCSTCYQNLVVARIVVACEHGHIDDFPWIKWVHCQNSGGPKSICDNPSLKFMTSASSSEGLEGLSVVCERCNARATLRGAFDPEKLKELDEKYEGKYDFSCTGRHPWKNTKDGCGLYPKVLQRGSSSVYFPVLDSSLVIPPYSSIVTSKIDNSSAYARAKDILNALLKTPGLNQEAREAIIENQINQSSNEIALEIGIDVQQVKDILIRKWVNSENETPIMRDVKYRREEYEALSGRITVASDDYGDFQREETNIDNYNIPLVSKVSLIHKIREVTALLGYSRIKPTEPSSDEGNNARMVSIKQPDTSWYPAVEVRGEGIFIEFDEDQIDKWRSENSELKKRVDIINENYKNSYIGSAKQRNITAKFLLLHTISHLLIKQLSFECGYGIASLKERIYCCEPSEGPSMSGILIYTASGDSEGTLGGLVRQGRDDTFPKLFKKAIEGALTCSNDPVCSLSLGQGRDSLNLSACYSCTLIPETSCEEFNVFLDRATVIGTFENPQIGIFNEYLAENGWKSNSGKMKAPTRMKKETKSVNLSVLDYGLDMSEGDYREIWESLYQFSSDETEKELLKKFMNEADKFENKEMPYQGATCFINDEISVELIWKNSKVAFFTSDNCDNYLKAKECKDWICVLGSDDNISFEYFINLLKEKK